ncbi:alpha/beta hydrolase family protein [Spirosoma radiotolerans]|uniref:Alpha/beta hydrolase n=1 Tax=Spirosoma radiotolerans TaxID=1379870 RepID=A0A0E3V7S1_9BACT|nr:alpha/beta fold hydrolase [Spirosoma radiotolerans]AKD55691.1 alpha/beta hydrolase [Spirosoma radiotolerans]
MKRLSCLIFLLVSICLQSLAQTEEPMHYRVTVPAGTELTLDGTLTLPGNHKKAVPVVLLIAGSGPTDRDCNNPYGLKTNAFKMLADSLASRGIAVARYDKRGSGTNLKAAQMVIKPEEFVFGHYVSDAVGFIRQLQADKRFSKVVVAGHSEGALVGMLAAEETKANGFVSIAGAGRNIVDVMKEQGRMAGNPNELQAEVDGALDSLRNGQMVHPKNPILKAQLSAKAQPGLISMMKYDPAVVIKAYNGPVLIIQGKKDLQVAVTDAELLKAARPDATLMLFDAMNHILKNVEGTDKTENVKTYSKPDLPITPGLATAIEQFVIRKRS